MEFNNTQTDVFSKSLLIAFGSLASSALEDFYYINTSHEISKIHFDSFSKSKRFQKNIFDILNYSDCLDEEESNLLAKESLSKIRSISLKEWDSIILIIDLFSPNERQAALETSIYLNTNKIEFISIFNSQNKIDGFNLRHESEKFMRELQKYCTGSLLIDGNNFGPLDNTIPYIHHACQTIISASDKNGYVNVSFKDVCNALTGVNSNLGYALLAENYDINDVEKKITDQLFGGRLLNSDDLRRATALLVVIEGKLKVGNSYRTKYLMKLVNKYTSLEANAIFAFAYNDNIDYNHKRLGLTILSSY